MKKTLFKVIVYIFCIFSVVELSAEEGMDDLEKKNFFKPSEKKPIMLENLRSIFYKMELSKKETRILSSVFASLAKKR